MFSWRRSETVKPQVWHTFERKNPKNNEIEHFIVQDLPKERFNDALSFMFKNFLPDEPICKSKNVESNKSALDEICKLWRNVLNQNVVLVCFKRNCDEIVGLNMVCVITKEELEAIQIDIHKNNTWKAVHDFALKAFKEIFLQRYKFADKVLIAYGLSVSKNFRQRGIAAEILRSRVPLCKALGIFLTSTVFTAIGSQKPAERVGFEMDFEINYEELAEYNKEFTFKNLETSSLKLMSLVIE